MSKRFDAVEFMRRRREEIDREDSGLSWEEKSRRTLERLQGDPLWERLKDRVVPTAAALRMAPGSLSAREAKERYKKKTTD
jgi:hypothetical protein